MAAAIDARLRTGQRWHDMAAGVSVKREKSPIPLRVSGKVVILHCRFGTLRTYSVTAPKGIAPKDEKHWRLEPR